MDYRPRVVDQQLTELLQVAPAVNLIGPRASGKTTTALQQAASSWRLDPAAPASIELAREDPSLALSGDEPRLIDEWQLVPTLWDAVRRNADDAPGRGKFILSGSAWPDDDARRHSGAGRIVDLIMRPMSLCESGDSTGQVSLRSILDGTQAPVLDSPLSVSRYADLIVRGGWPGWIDLQGDQARPLVDAYLAALQQRDFPLVAGNRRAPGRFAQFITAYASLTAHPKPLSTVAKRLADDGITVGRDFATTFHEFATRMFLVEDQPAWSSSRRSRNRLVANPKRHLADPSLAASALHLSPEGLRQDWETFGLLFESLVVRDLRVYSQPLGGKVFHYRTHDAAQEIDAVVEFSDGRWLGVEVKLGYQAARTAAERLTSVTAAFKHPPTALMVVTGDAPATRQPNGVWIVPLGLLGP